MSNPAVNCNGTLVVAGNRVTVHGAVTTISGRSRGAWDEAAGTYKAILQQNPSAPRIHYRLGQVLLSKAGETGPVDDARAEFQKELQVDPRNASAEFVLGELARRAGQWDEAAQHF